MSFLDSLFGKNPYEAAQPYLDQIPGMVKENYGPYRESGLNASQTLNPLYTSMATNPYGKYNEIYNSYEPSAGYGFKADQLNKAATSAASAGGFLGTPYDEQRRAELTKALMSDDFQQYFNNITGIENSGISGLQGVADTGYNATGDLTTNLGNSTLANANAAYGGQQFKNDRKKMLIDAIAEIAAAYASGGLTLAAKGTKEAIGAGANAAKGFGAGASAGGNLSSGGRQPFLGINWGR